MTTYRVVIVGLKTGQDVDEVAQQLAAMFKQPVQRMRALVTASRAEVKHGADIALATRMQVAIQGAGCKVVVEPEVSEAPATSKQSEIHTVSTTGGGMQSDVPPKILGAIATQPNFWKRKTVKFGGGFILLCLALLIAAAISSTFQDSPKPMVESSAPEAVRKQKESAQPSSAPPPTTAPTQATAAPGPTALALVGTWICRDIDTERPYLKSFFSVAYGSDGTYRTVTPAANGDFRRDASGRYELTGSRLHVVFDRTQVGDKPIHSRQWEQVFQLEVSANTLYRNLVARTYSDSSEWDTWPAESPQFRNECVREGMPVPDSWQGVDTPRGFVLAMEALKAKCQHNGNLNCALTCNALENQALVQLGRFNKILTGDPTEVPAAYPPQFRVGSMLENFHRLCVSRAGER